MTVTTGAARAAPPRRGPRARSSAVRVWVRGAAGIGLLVVVLEIVSRLGIVNPVFLPPFSEVLRELVVALGQPEAWVAIFSTLLSWFLGLLVSSLIAIPLGILFGLSELSYRASRTLVELIRPMPAIALIPLVTLAVGPGLDMKVIVAVYAALWPILFNTIYGVHGVDPGVREMARTFGQSRTQIIRRVVIPGAAPVIATGVRISSAIVLIVVITVELIAGGADGIGAFIASNRATGTKVALVYAGIVLAGVLGLVINVILGRLERRLFGWHTQGRG